MQDDARHQRIAQRFLVSLVQQYGLEAPVALRAMADDLERILATEKERADTPESAGPN